MKSLKSLELICQVKDFENKPFGKQVEIIEALLETDAGKEVMYKKNVENLIKQFCTSRRSPIVIKLLKDSRKAQEYFLNEEWKTYSHVNQLLETWLFDKGLFEVYISDDEKIIGIPNNRIWPMDSVIIDNVTLNRKDNFDLWIWMNSENYNSDNVYFVRGKGQATVWWNFYSPDDF